MASLWLLQDVQEVLPTADQMVLPTVDLVADNNPKSRVSGD